MSRRHIIVLLAVGLALCATFMFVILPRTRLHSLAKSPSSLHYVRVISINEGINSQLSYSWKV